MDSAADRGMESAKSATREPAVLPPTSVIIPTRNRRDLLHDTVRSVLAGDEVPTELIVADQSDAPDRTIADMGRVRQCEVRYLWERGTGVSRARNAAMSAARTDILVFTDDDVLVEPSWLGALVRALLRAGRRAVVTGRVLDDPGGPPGWFAPSLKTEESPETYRGRVGRDVLFSANMAMDRSTAAAVGFFDERLRRAQDNDYGFRLLEAGYTILYVPDAALVHRAARSAKQYLPLRWRYGVGQGRFYAKHFDLRDPYIVRRMATDVAQRVRSLPFLLVREPRRALGNATFMLGVMVGAAGWMIPPIRGRSHETAPAPLTGASTDLVRGSGPHGV